MTLRKWEKRINSFYIAILKVGCLATSPPPHITINSCDGKSSRTQGWHLNDKLKESGKRAFTVCSVQNISFRKTKTSKSINFTKGKGGSPFFSTFTTVRIEKTPLPRKLLIFSVSVLIFRLHFYDTVLSVGNILYSTGKSKLLQSGGTVSHLNHLIYF